MAEFFGKGFECWRTFAASPLPRSVLRHGWRTGGLPRLRHSNRRNSGPDGATEPKVGLLPCAGGTRRLSWLVGGMGKKMILCGERVNAETAGRIGLVEEVVATGGAQERALELAAKLPAKPHFGDLLQRAYPSGTRQCRRRYPAYEREG